MSLAERYLTDGLLRRVVLVSSSTRSPAYTYRCQTPPSWRGFRGHHTELSVRFRHPLRSLRERARKRGAVGNRGKSRVLGKPGPPHGCGPPFLSDCGTLTAKGGGSSADRKRPYSRSYIHRLARHVKRLSGRPLFSYDAWATGRKQAREAAHTPMFRQTGLHAPAGRSTSTACARPATMTPRAAVAQESGR
jgi:hypothetical protein